MQMLMNVLKILAKMEGNVTTMMADIAANAQKDGMGRTVTRVGKLRFTIFKNKINETLL